MIRHPKRRGEWVELQFMARAAAHNLIVSKPWGDSARYDFIVEHRGAFRRVQVKSTMFHNGFGYLCGIESRGPSRSRAAYKRGEIDFFALYVIPEEIWYIVPPNKLRGVKHGVLLDPRKRTNRFFRFMEAWHLLTAEGRQRRRREGK